MLSRIALSPGGDHTAEFLYAGEIRFGPAYYMVRLDGRLLRKHLFGMRYFGEGCLWSADSRYLALSEWRSFAEKQGPDTQLVVIDIPAQRDFAVARVRGGFGEPARFEGNTLVYTRTSYDKQVRAHVESCIIDLPALRHRRKVAGSLRAAVVALVAALLALIVSYKTLLWALIKYWERQHDGRRMMFIFWAEERALPWALLVCAVVFFFTFMFIQRRKS
jgi:hypothetical protein